MINSGYPLQANIKRRRCHRCGAASFARAAEPMAPCGMIQRQWPTGGDCGAFRRVSRANRRASQYQRSRKGAHHSFAIATNGSLWAWGANDKGQLGVAPLFEMHAGATGRRRQCHRRCRWRRTRSALTRSGALYAWGANARRQLGDGTTVDKSAPVLIGTALPASQQGRCGFA